MNNTDNSRIRIVAGQGSVRPGNFTGKALALVIDELKRHEDLSVELIDPATVDLAPPGKEGSSAALKALHDSVGQATGVILATPEYHGSFSSIMKLFIENLGNPSVLSTKPVALLGVWLRNISPLLEVCGPGTTSQSFRKILPIICPVWTASRMADNNTPHFKNTGK